MMPIRNRFKTGGTTGIALAVLGMTLCLPALAQQTPDPKKDGKSKTKTVQTPPQQNGTAPKKPPKRLFVPGIGGAAPSRVEKPAAPPVNPLVVPPPGGKPLVFPNGRLPRVNNNAPAPVIVPGERAPLPGFTSGFEARPVNPFLYGMAVQWGDDGGMTNWERQNGARAKRLTDLLKNAGAKNVLLTIRWAEVERVRGHYDWTATDRLLKYVSAQGITPVVTIVGTPDWALDHAPATLELFAKKNLNALLSRRPPEPEFEGNLAKFALACGLRFKGRVEYYAFWQEPDGGGMPVVTTDMATHTKLLLPDGDATRYAHLLRIFALNLKKSDPKAKVAVGGLHTHSTDFLTALYNQKAPLHFDAVALNAVDGANPFPMKWLEACRDIMVRNGDAEKNVWLTAWGWNSAPGQADSLTELHQARLIRETLAALRERPYVTVAVYRALNDALPVKSAQNALPKDGIVTASLKPKPGYFAFREAATGAPAEPNRAYKRVPLLGALPLVDEGGLRGTAINVVVDADRTGAPTVPLWAGVAQGNDPGGAVSFAAAINRLKDLHVRLVRFDPFPDAGMVHLESGGDVPVVDWQTADTMLDSIAKGGAKPLIHFATLPGMFAVSQRGVLSETAREAYGAWVRRVVTRWNGEQKRGIVYWECGQEPERGQTPDEWAGQYAAFARAVVAADPQAKVGGAGLGTYRAEWVRGFVDNCAKNGVPLHFLAWHVYDQSPAETARQVKEARAILKAVPAFRDTEILLDEWNVHSVQNPDHDTLKGAVFALDMAEALADVMPVQALFYRFKEGRDFRRPDQMLTGQTGLLTLDNTPKPVYNALRLLSHLEGRSVAAASEETGIHVLGAVGKTEEGVERVSVLVWRGGSSGSLSDARDALDVPVRVRLRGLPWLRGGKSPGTHGELWVLDGKQGNLAVSASNAENLRSAAWDVEAGDIEVPVVLPAEGLTLLELTASRPGSFAVSVSTPTYIVYGGSSVTLTGIVRNVTTSPQRVSPVFAAADGTTLRNGAYPPLTLKPGETHEFKYTFITPPVPPEKAEFGQAFYRFRVGKASATTAIRTAAPVRARLETVRADIARPNALPDSQDATVKVKVVLENKGSAPVKLSVGAGSLLENVTVPARNTVTVPVSVSGASLSPGVYVRPIRVVAGTKTLAVLDAKIAVPGLCRFTAVKPRIDGLLNEWAGVAPLELKPLDVPNRGTKSAVVAAGQGGTQTPAASELAAQAFTLWDDEHFYLAVSVTDTTLFQPFAPEKMMLGDAVLFSLRSGDENRGAVTYGIPARTTGAALYRMPANEGGVAFRMEKAQVAVRRIGNRTLYEMAIPWAELGVRRPAADTLSTFSLVVTDSDGNRRGSLLWGSGLRDAAGSMEPGGLRFLREKANGQP